MAFSDMQLAAILEVDSADADQARAVRGAQASGRLVELQDMLAARQGRPGFGVNERMISAEIARLQQEA